MVCSASCACLPRCACAQDSPSFSSLFADIDATALQGERLETLCAYVSSGPKSGTAPRASERDAWWRAVIGAALGDAKVGALHAVHEEGLELNGRLGELGDVEGCFPTGRAALKAGCSVAALLGGQRYLEASVSIVLPGRCEATPLRVVLCARAAVGDTPYFKERRWTEEVSDGKARNLAYVSIPSRINVETSAQGALLLKGNEGALAGAIFKADEAVNPRGCVEYSRQLYGGDGRPTQMLFGLASGAAFGALPGRARFCVGPVGQDRHSASQVAWRPRGSSSSSATSPTPSSVSATAASAAGACCSPARTSPRPSARRRTTATATGCQPCLGRRCPCEGLKQGVVPR